MDIKDLNHGISVADSLDEWNPVEFEQAKTLMLQGQSIDGFRCPLIQRFGDSGVYIDKTKLLMLCCEKRSVFLARPRRMGKTITVDTFKAMSQSAYLETVDPNYVLPDCFQNTAFAKADARSKLFICAPFVVRLDFKDVDLSDLLKISEDLQTTIDNYNQDKSDINKKLEELKQQKQAEVAELEQQKQAKLAELEQQKQAKLAELEQQKQAKLAELEKLKHAKLAELEQLRQAESAELEQQKQAKLAELEQTQKAELDALEHKVLVVWNRSYDDYLKSLSELRSYHSNTRAELREEFAQKLDSLNDSFYTQLKIIDDGHDKQLDSLNDSFYTQLKIIDDGHDKQLNRIDDDYDKQLKRIDDQHNKQFSFLQSEQPQLDFLTEKTFSLENMQGSLDLQLCIDDLNSPKNEIKNQYVQELESVRADLKLLIDISRTTLFETVGINNLEYNLQSAKLLKKANINRLIKAWMQVNFLSIFCTAIVESLKWHIDMMLSLDQTEYAQESKSILDSLLNLIPRVVDKVGGGEFVKGLSELIQLMPKQSIVLLIDEYDSVITASLKQAKVLGVAMNTMRLFYDAIKRKGDHIKFTFVTGITNYEKVSLFSDANQFVNISYQNDFSGITGFSEYEIKKYLTPAVCRMAVLGGITPSECLEQMKHFYNGYCFAIPNLKDESNSIVKARTSQPTTILNPISVNGFLGQQSFDFPVAWIESGSNLSDSVSDYLMSFDKDELDFTIFNAKKGLLSLNRSEVIFPKTISVKTIRTSLPVFLFQSGYLTIDWNKSIDTQTIFFKVPNKEVELMISPCLSGIYRLSKISWSDSHKSEFTANSQYSAVVLDKLFSENELPIEKTLFNFYVNAVAFDTRTKLNESGWRDFLFNELDNNIKLKLFKEASCISVERESINSYGIADIVLTDRTSKKKVVLELKVNKITSKSSDVKRSQLEMILQEAMLQVISRYYGRDNDHSLTCYVCVINVNMNAKQENELNGGTSSNFFLTCAQVPKDKAQVESYARASACRFMSDKDQTL